MCFSSLTFFPAISPSTLYIQCHIKSVKNACEKKSWNLYLPRTVHTRRCDDIYDFQPQIDVNSSKDMCKIGGCKVLVVFRVGKFTNIYHRRMKSHFFSWINFFVPSSFFFVMCTDEIGRKEWHNLHLKNNYFSTSMNFLLSELNEDIWPAKHANKSKGMEI